ncbi:hypothetical protein [Paratractidigestivibacter sp.]|uniref:hypothetical protein n=1 Tax=Paratractidigestivibacter sp. TaxID=2847316 RepID=UPI002AC8E607|nr:hypothetical protein [Paratractidigestivibacter sp.]
MTSYLKFKFTLGSTSGFGEREVKASFPGIGTSITIKVEEGDVTGSKSGSYNANTGKVTWIIALKPTSNMMNLVVTDTLGRTSCFSPTPSSLTAIRLPAPSMARPQPLNEAASPMVIQPDLRDYRWRARHRRTCQRWEALRHR